MATEELPGFKVFDNDPLRTAQISAHLEMIGGVPFLLIHEAYREIIGGRETSRTAIDIAYEHRLVDGVMVIMYRMTGEVPLWQDSPLRRELEKKGRALFLQVRDEEELANHLKAHIVGILR